LTWSSPFVLGKSSLQRNLKFAFCKGSAIFEKTV
jgi:hypothetical protein